MYIGSNDTDEYIRQRQILRKKWKRRQRIKRIFAIFVLLAGVSLICLVLYFAGKGIYSAIKSDSGADKEQYIEEASTIEIKLVDNVFEVDKTVSSDNSGISNEINAVISASDEIDYSQYNSSGLIIIDAGHGGMDGGTSSSLSAEKDINLEITFWLKEELENRGYSVYLTRSDDTYVGLQQRANLANEQKNALAMVSIHQNACEEAESVAGIEAWTYERSGCIELAHFLADEVSESTGASNRGVSYRTNLVVTSKTTLPSVIIECGYLTNNNEAELLTTDEYQIKIARGIANALDKFIESYY